MSGDADPWAFLDRPAVVAPDLDLPEIVLVPGFLGVHLARPDGTRLWLTPEAMATRHLASELRFDPAGPPLLPDGPVGFIYADLVRRLRDAGFVVHAFSYDFRRSALDAARLLAGFIDALAQATPGKRYVLVAHSLGAIVAGLYACVDPRWKSRVTGSIFLGGTLAGTFESIEVARGTHPILTRIENLVLRDDSVAFGACQRTWPGLFSMLPDPDTFAGGAAAFDASAWPRECAPQQAPLTEAREVRRLLRTSPIFDAPAAQLISVRFATIDSYGPGPVAVGPSSAPGDGTVSARAASFRGVPAYHVDFPHTFLPVDPKAIRGVIDLARSGTTDLERVTEAQCSAPLEGQEPLLLGLLQGVGTSLLDCVERGGLRAAHVVGLLGPPGPRG